MYRTKNVGSSEIPSMYPGQASSGHTKVSYKETPSFLTSIANSIFAAFIGILFVFGSFALLFWNEGRAVQTALSLDEGLKTVVSLPSSDVISQSYNNKLVHTTGQLRTDSLLSDIEFGIAIKAVKLKREVEMFQWREHQSTKEYPEEGGRTRVETTYSYSTEWSSDIIESKHFDDVFGHENPHSMPLHSAVQVASTAYAGNFILSDGLLDKITDFKELSPSEVPSGKKYKLLGGYFYLSDNPHHPKVGDIRVKFSYAGYCGKAGSRLGDPQVVSVVAKQEGMMLRQFNTKAGDSLELLYPGKLSAEEIFEAEVSANITMTWGLRFLGWLLMFVGFLLMTSILTTLVSWIPLVRDLVGLSVLILCFSLSFSLSLFTIAIGWFVYRPVLSLTLIAVALTPWCLAKYRAYGASHKNPNKI